MNYCGCNHWSKDVCPERNCSWKDWKLHNFVVKAPFMTIQQAEKQPARECEQNDKFIQELLHRGHELKKCTGYNLFGDYMISAAFKLREKNATQPQAEALRVPDGYVLVPVEPTGEMLDAGQRQYQSGDAYNAVTGAAIVWEHMLAAAPKPQPTADDAGGPQ